MAHPHPEWWLSSSGQVAQSGPDYSIESNPSDKAVVDVFDDLGRIIGIDYIFK